MKSDLVMRRMPSTQSSMNVKLRVCLPSPHISMSLMLVSTCKAAQGGGLETAVIPQSKHSLNSSQAIILRNCQKGSVK